MMMMTMLVEDDLSFDEDDEDYVYSESGESSDEDVQTLVNERKFIVFESMLDELFIFIYLFVKYKRLTQVVW